MSDSFCARCPRSCHPEVGTTPRKRPPLALPPKRRRTSRAPSPLIRGGETSAALISLPSTNQKGKLISPPRMRRGLRGGHLCAGRPSRYHALLLVKYGADRSEHLIDAVRFLNKISHTFRGDFRFQLRFNKSTR